MISGKYILKLPNWSVTIAVCLTLAGFQLRSADRPAGPENAFGGLHYVWWNFAGPQLTDLQVEFSIHSEPDNRDGLYFQFYQGQINGHGFYFGLQTDIAKPGAGGQGRGLIFSRWGSRDPALAAPAPGGWSEAAGYEGDFVGVRRKYSWKTGRYRIRLAPHVGGVPGDWYGIWIRQLETAAPEEFGGALRFDPPAPGHARGISATGCTWTELYAKDKPGTPLPAWHVSIDAIAADGNTRRPMAATAEYSKVSYTDIAADPATGAIHFTMGPAVERRQPRGALPLPPAPPIPATGK